MPERSVAGKSAVSVRSSEFTFCRIRFGSREQAFCYRKYHPAADVGVKRFNGRFAPPPDELRPEWRFHSDLCRRSES